MRLITDAFYKGRGHHRPTLWDRTTEVQARRPCLYGRVSIPRPARTTKVVLATRRCHATDRKGFEADDTRGFLSSSGRYFIEQAHLGPNSLRIGKPFILQFCCVPAKGAWNRQCLGYCQACYAMSTSLGVLRIENALRWRERNAPFVEPQNPDNLICRCTQQLCNLIYNFLLALYQVLVSQNAKLGLGQNGCRWNLVFNAL